MDVFKEFRIEAAHFLPNTPDGHKCRRLHGHSYLIRVVVSGDVLGGEGWVVDFGDIKGACSETMNEIDHRYLNDIPGLENPTGERLAEWLWKRLAPRLRNLSRIEVRETCTAGVVFEGPAEG